MLCGDRVRHKHSFIRILFTTIAIILLSGKANADSRQFPVPAEFVYFTNSAIVWSCLITVGMVVFAWYRLTRLSGISTDRFEEKSSSTAEDGKENK